MHPELRRALAFEEALRERCADRTVPFRFGRALFTDAYPAVWDLNGLRVEAPAGATAQLLAAEADRLHGEAGHAHRRVVVEDERAGEALADGFRALGWEATGFLYMAWRGSAERVAGAAVAVEEVAPAELRALREEISRTAPGAGSEEVVRMIADAAELVARMAGARHFAVRADGELASAADLYSDGRTAQVEDVVTSEAHRGRGYASAVVLRAVEEALAAGHDLVFLVADDEDWPKDLYARLGFEPIGRTWAFLRRPAPASPA